MFREVIQSHHHIQYRQIDEALTLSKNISYVNGILNNKVNNDLQSESGSSLGYDWFNN